MSRLRNRVSQTVTGVSGADLTLGAAVPGYATMQAAYGGVATAGISYLLVDGTAWEIGYGSFSGTTIFTRAPIASSADGALIATSTSAVLSVTMLAEDAPVDWPILIVSRQASGGGFQDLPQAFTTITLSQAATVDSHGGWNTADYTYTVPMNGTYDCQGKFRLYDGAASGRSVGIGIDVTNQDGAGFVWVTTSGPRNCLYNSRALRLTKGQKVRLFGYADGVTQSVTSAELIMARIR